MDLAVAEKRCSKCKTLLPCSEFNARRASDDGLAYICRPCCKIYSKGRKHKTRPYDRERWLRKSYGITPQQYDEMFADQNGVCAICKDGTRKTRWGTLCVDHDHHTGRNRGLLCTNCNQAIGKLQDSVLLLHLAIEYLEAHKP